MNQSADIEQAMIEIACRYCTTLYSPSLAEGTIAIIPRIEGKKVIFKMNLYFQHLDRFQNQAEDDAFMNLLETQMETTIHQIQNDVDAWARTHEGTIDFLDFE